MEQCTRNRIFTYTGSYHSESDVQHFRDKVELIELSNNVVVSNRIFHIYGTLSDISSMADYIQELFLSRTGFNRILYDVKSNNTAVPQQNDMDRDYTHTIDVAKKVRLYIHISSYASINCNIVVYSLRAYFRKTICINIWIHC